MTTETFVDERPGTSRGRLGVALAIAVTVLIIEIFGAAISGSLALFADAGHVFSDVLGLLVALVAATIARKPATDRHTFGFQRAEVFGAMANGVIVLAAAIFVLYEGFSRWVSPEGGDVDPVPMLIVAAIGLVGNVIALVVLHSSASESINMRGAYLEVLGDTLGSIAAIIASAIILATGFATADTVASLVIVIMMVPRALSLLRDVFRVLSTSAPVDTDIAHIRATISGVEGVVDVHDIHVWSITSGQHVFSAHVVVEPSVFSEAKAGPLLDRLSELLSDRFDVSHSTFQLEPEEHAHHEPPQHL